MSIRVLLADDHPVVRSGIMNALAVDDAISVVGEAKDAPEAQALCQDLGPDILLLDISMPGPSITETINALRQRCPATRIIILSAHNEDTYIRSVMRAGVSGYLLKEEAVDTVVKAVHAVHHGAAWYSQAVAERFTQGQFGQATEVDEIGLTPREQDLLSLMVKGWDNARIAQELFLAEQTVPNYTATLYEKLGVHSRAEAIVWGLEHGFAGKGVYSWLKAKTNPLAISKWVMSPGGAALCTYHRIGLDQGSLEMTVLEVRVVGYFVR